MLYHSCVQFSVLLHTLVLFVLPASNEHFAVGRPEKHLYRHGQKCDPKFSALSVTHTACLRTPKRPHEGLNDAERQKILALHNYYRGKAGNFGDQPQAADMQRMTWDSELELLAQKWASNCRYSHDNKESRVIPGRFKVGQNIAWTSLFDWPFTVKLWHDEVYHFLFGHGTLSPGEPVGHYTQMLWATTSRLGCGYAFCNGTRHYYVCNYGPVGNVEKPRNPLTVNRPYTQGPRGSMCPYTYNHYTGLCDCGGKICNNGGKLDLDTCTCKCLDLAWIDKDKDCALDCSRSTQSFFCDYKSWGPAKCVEYVNVPYYCPIMCKWCPDARRKTWSPTVPSVWRRTTLKQLTNRQKPSRKGKGLRKPSGENELPLGDQPPEVSEVPSTTTTSTTTTTTTTTTTNVPAIAKGRLDQLPQCRKTEPAICGQPHSKGYIHVTQCRNSYVRFKCPALCGLCSGTSCMDYENKVYHIGDTWLIKVGQMTCSTSGLIFQPGCFIFRGTVYQVYVPEGGQKSFSKGNEYYECQCDRADGKRMLTCTKSRRRSS